ncbi:MAG TPA: hypothetical protein VF494_05490 [Candidatus Limnocylindrales bacterium]
MKTNELSPFTTLIPQSPLDPIVIFNEGAALRMAVAEKEAIALLDPDWERPGVYLLLYPLGADGLFEVYVGKASTGGLRSRMLSHKNVKAGWIRALLITKDTTHGYNSAHVGWLEGRLHSLVKAAARAKVVNAVVPGVENLPAFDRATLELAIEPIRQVMRLLGYSLAPEDEAAPIKAAITRHHHGVKVADLIKAGLLDAGDTLEFTWTGHEGIQSTVLADGQLLMNGTSYATPSAAGQAARGGIVNGWEYWAVRDANNDLVSLGELREQLPKSAGNGSGGPA